MATQWQAIDVAHLSTTEGDTMALYREAGIWWVAFVYADQSPQFIRCETPEEAKRLYATAAAQADAKGKIKGSPYSSIDLSGYVTK
ncbi:hypothetical protein [Streptomyces erythrochromogenes]|uniref:hypothetical protein n=1 Tax=Streptomyces erythrochromogenes TaxID=285574 RepID=UPI0037D90D40